MELIKPREISGSIMTLLEEADEKVVIVSPYYQIGNWPKLLNSLVSLKNRKIDVEFYVREGEEKSFNEIKKQGFLPIPIVNLHTKLYLNEKIAIVSSMNLNISSDNNSLDIALKTENKEEYDGLFEYYRRYIKGSTINNIQKIHSWYDWREDLEKRLGSNFKRRINIKESTNKLEINTSNRYDVFISNGRKNELRISGILSNKEFIKAKNENVFKNTKMSIEVIAGGNGYYDTIWGGMPNIRSKSINELVNEEVEIVVDSILNFILDVEKFKQTLK